MNDFITGEKFITVADFIYVPKNKTDCNPLVNTFNSRKLEKKNIIYTHTLYVKELFDEIKNLKSEFIIVTHNCDENVDDSYVIPDNVIKWFSQNVNVINEKIESIPIGLENDKWYPLIRKKEKMEKMVMQSKGCRNWVYMNHNVKTNPKERQHLYDLFKHEKWVTTENETNGTDFDRYLGNVYNHRFVICPRGNGLDTHRFWECLYMNSIPIVKKDINNSFYQDMPVLYLNNWDELNEELLIDIWDVYKDGEYDKNKLTFEYWKNKIQDAKIH